MEVFIELILLFTIYSFIGWVCETCCCSFLAKKFVNRGFLNGPFCPVYGFGALIAVFLLSPFTDTMPFPGNYIVLYLAGTVLMSILEYFTGFLLEKLFHTKWWDYSDRKFNLKGRVCLGNALLFGLMAILVMEFVHPAVMRLLGFLPFLLSAVLAAVLFIYFIADCCITVRTILQLNGKLAQLQQVLDEIKEKTETAKQERLAEFQKALGEARQKAAAVKGEKQAQLQQALDSILDEETRAKFRQLREKQHRMEESRALQRRVLNAFPNMKSVRHPESLERLKEALKNRKKK